MSRQRTIEEINANLKGYFEGIKKENSNSIRHRFYLKTVKHAEQMGVHIEGHTPEALLKIYRPHEDKKVRKYRLEIWKAITESFSEKIINTVAKIFDPKAFTFKTPKNPTKVKDDESLEEYLTKNFGIYKNMWVFARETLLTMLFSDSNAVMVMLPSKFDITDGEHFEPIPLIFRSEFVVDFVDDEYYTIYIPEVKNSPVNMSKGKRKMAGHFMIIDQTMLRTWSVINGNLVGAFEFDMLSIDESGFLPALRLGGKVKGSEDPYWYKSFVGGIQPHWDKVINWVSDLDGSIVNHLYPEKYEYQEQCRSCKGSKKISVPTVGSNMLEIDCPTCEGAGEVTNRSPYGILQLKRDVLNPEIPLPDPPAGYIDKDIEPIRELRSLIAEAELKGFESINMEIVHRVGENQSGIAKVIDRDPLTSFLMRVSSHSFQYILKPMVVWTAKWRMYTVLGTGLADFINGIELSEPKNLSVISLDNLLNELKVAREAGLDSNLLVQIQREIVKTRFANSPFQLMRNMAIIDLKPFPHRSMDDLLTAKASNAIREIDFKRNENIDELVDKGIQRNANFLELEKSEQITILEEIINEEYTTTPAPTIPIEPIEEDVEVDE